MPVVSYSQYSMYSSCPHQYKLRYIDKLSKSSGNIHTIFGTALHETIQNYLTVMYEHSKKKADEINMDTYLMERLKDAFKKEHTKLDEGVYVCTQEELEEFYGDGRRVIQWFLKNINKFYRKQGWSLVGIEVPLNIDLKGNLRFYGLVDVVVKDEGGNYIIIDIKTSTKGWTKWDKNDDTKMSQILLYKKFYSEKFDVPMNRIKVEFHIFKRKDPDYDTPYAIPMVSKHVPANGAPTVNKAHSAFMEFVNTVFNDEGEIRTDIQYKKVPGKNKKNCKFCEFGQNGLCDGIAD